MFSKLPTSDRTRRKVTRAPRTRCSPEQLVVCAEMYTAGHSIREIAQHFKVSRFAIERRIVLSAEGRQKQRQSRSRKAAEKLSKKVRQLSMDGEFIQEWVSLASASRSLDINPGGISNVLAGRTISAGGFRWESGC